VKRRKYDPLMIVTIADNIVVLTKGKFKKSVYVSHAFRTRSYLLIAHKPIFVDRGI
jgi:hypothetical protein